MSENVFGYSDVKLVLGFEGDFSSESKFVINGILLASGIEERAGEIIVSEQSVKTGQKDVIDLLFPNGGKFSFCIREKNLAKNIHDRWKRCVVGFAQDVWQDGPEENCPLCAGKIHLCWTGEQLTSSPSQYKITWKCDTCENRFASADERNFLSPDRNPRSV